nr:alpha/beta hydrolase [bacterium]
MIGPTGPGLPAFDRVGQGRPVLLLHGWGGNADSMQPVTQTVADAGMMAIVPDFPGHGRTPPPDTAWGVEEFAGQMLALLDSLGVERCDIIAHSFGGRVALVLAAHHPERVGRMVLTGCAGIRPRRGLIKRLKVLAYKCGKKLASRPAAAKICAKMGIDLAVRMERAGSADYRAIRDKTMRQTFVRVVGEDLSPLLPLIQAPTIAIWGDRDDATPLWMGCRMARRMQDCALIPFEGEGHFAYLTQSQRFNRIALYFLLDGRRDKA